MEHSMRPSRSDVEGLFVSNCHTSRTREIRYHSRTIRKCLHNDSTKVEACSPPIIAQVRCRVKQRLEPSLHDSFAHKLPSAAESPPGTER